MKSTFARVALRTSLLYALVAGVWILLSSRILVAFVSNPDVRDRLEIYKGWAFVAVTALLLYTTLRGQMRRLEREAMERKRAEDALRKSEEQHRMVLDNQTEMIFRFNPDHALTFVNGVFCRFFGKTRPELLGSKWQPGVLPEDLPLVENRIQMLAPATPIVLVENRVRSAGGEVRWMQFSHRAFFDGQNRLVEVQAVGRDVTERKRVEQDLQMYEFSIDQASDAIFWMTREAGLTYVNEQACRSLGYTREELMRLHLWDFDPVFPRERWDADWQQFQDDKGGAQRFESFHRRKDGSVFPVSISAKHLWFGHTELHVAVVRDITELKHADEANARLATAVQQAAEAIIITDPKGTILYVNPAFERTSGYTSPEAVGRNPRIFKSGKHDAAFYRQMWDTLSRGTVWSGRIINKKKNGAFYEEETSISPVFDSNGKIANYVAVKRDVTQEAVLETQLRQAQKMEIIGQLAGGVAHDFNNILTIIQGNASLLLNGELKPAEKTECTQQIIHAAERAAGLTRQLLMFSRKQVMQPANLNLNGVVAQMTKMLRRILGEHISMHSNYAANLPFIYGDIGMIEQVLMNLVVNARDAMPAGGSLTIATGMKMVDREQAQQNPGASPGLHVWLAVSDTGSGIVPENLPRIFEPFFTTKEVGKGTGLGLATVYGIVQQHRGWITVSSETSKGTIFQIHFPAVANADPGKNAGRPIA